MKLPGVVDRLYLTQTEFIIFLMTAAFLLLAILVILSLFIFRIRKNARTSRQKYLRQQFQLAFNQMIVNEVFSKDGSPVSAFGFQLAEVRRIAGNSTLARQAMVDQLISMRKNLTGASGAILNKVYRELDGHRFSSSKLKSFSWKIQAQGIRELTEMNDTDSLKKIMQFVTSKNLTLREEAIVSIVRQERPVTLKFLDSYDVPISSWLKINIHHHLAKIDMRDLPDFSQWFNHRNPSVVIFVIDMCKIFRRTSAIDRLSSLLDHPDRRVISAVLDALGDLEAYTAASEVASKSNLFWNDSELSQKFVTCLGRLANDESHMQVVAKFLDHPGYMVRFESVKALAALGKDGRKMLDEINIAANLRLSSMIRHVDEPLLK